MENARDLDIHFIPHGDKITFDIIPRDDNGHFELVLKEKIALSHDTNKYVFQLPEEDQVLGLKVGNHVSFHMLKEDGDFHTKRYTPVSVVNDKGIVSFVCKTYKICEEFPNGGKMSMYLDGLQVGDRVKMEGPFGGLNYLGNGNFIIRKNPVKKTKIGFIAGGTGINPCYQVIQASCHAKDGLDMVLLYSNKSKNDILLKEDLDEFAKVNPDHFKVYHTLTRHSTEKDGEWDGMVGRISAEQLKAANFPEPSEETLIMMCGPIAFNKHVEGLLDSLGYTKDMQYKF